VPRLVAVDTRQRLVVLEGAEGLHTLRAVGRGAPSPAHVVHLAAALSALHSLDVETVRADHPDRRLHLPIESMMDLTPAELALGPGSEYASYAKAVQAVDNEIRALIAGWRPNRLIHFDIRDANVLLAGGGQDRADPVRLVDWELAGWGDPLYDVGSLVGQLVYHSLRGTMLDAEHGLGQPAAMTFVGAYLRLARIERPDPLEAIVSYAGVFLLLRALATLQVTGSLGPVAKLALLLGGRFLSHPDTSADLLLPGLREPVA
jgi:Ser/Thr protein kinase RdoA (MazF antagonist)